MSNAGFSQQQPFTAEPGRDDLVASAIQELLNGIRQSASSRMDTGVNVERSAAEYAAVVLRGQVERQRVQVNGASSSAAPFGGLSSVAADLRRAVKEVRAFYMALAELEIRRMLDEALMGPDPSDDRPSRHVKDNPEPIEVPQAPVQHEQSSAALKQRAEDPSAEAGDGAAVELARDPNLYEGTVTLVVMANGNMQRVVRFVDELCQRPQFRMLRMAGSPQQQGAEVSLGLREPLAVHEIVRKMNNVRHVEVNDAAGPEGERTIIVHLASDAA